MHKQKLVTSTDLMENGANLHTFKTKLQVNQKKNQTINKIKKLVLTRDVITFETNRDNSKNQ